MRVDDLRTLTVPDVLERFKAYHAAHPMWGSLHIVLSDRNTEDHYVDFCVRIAFEQGDFEGHKLAQMLRQMSRTQRLRISQLTRDAV